MNKIQITENENPCFSYETKIRITDINYGNHLGHDKIISILHDARLSFFIQKKLSEINHENMYTFMLRSLTIDYKKECYLHEILIVEIYIGQIEKFTFELKYKVLKANEVIALCVTTLVCYNNLKRRPDVVPASILSALLS